MTEQGSLVESETSVQGSATRNSRTGEIIIKLVNARETAETLQLQVKGVSSLASTATAITLAAEPEDTNSITEPKKVVPIATTVPLRPAFTYRMPPHSIVILKLKTRS